MEKGSKVKIKATGIIGVVADFNKKLVNVTIDEKHLAPGDDTQAYVTHDEIEEVTEEQAPASENKEEITTETKTPSANEGADFLQQLVQSLQSQVEQLKTENEGLKLKLNNVVEALSEQ